MARNAFFGVKNAPIALLTNPDAVTYDKPVKIPGIVTVSIEPETGTSGCFADDEPWVETSKKHRGSGTLSFRDIDSDPEIRKLFADILGNELDANGRTLFTGKDPKPFAFLCEQNGSAAGTRICLMRCLAQLPKEELKTTENEEPDYVQFDIPVEWRSVTLADGTRLSRYKDYPNTDSYKTFFDDVATTFTPASEAAAVTE